VNATRPSNSVRPHGWIHCNLEPLASGPGDASPTVVQSRAGCARSRYAGPVLGTVAVFAVVAASCSSRQAVGSDGRFERRGLGVLLAAKDGGAPNALPVRDGSSHAVAECPPEPAPVTAPARARIEFRRQCDAGAAECFALLSVGPESLTPAELDAITKRVEAVDTQPVHSISRYYDEVIVWTGATCGNLCGSGHDYHLRKIGGTWEIICRGSWVS